jgi:hypothetical protein
MNIEKALSHFEWKLKNHWKPTAKDIEAFNSILDFKEHRQSISLSENELLAKMWIHQLMLLNATKMYSAKRAIQAIDEILEQTVYDWVLKLHEQSKMMRFNTLSYSEEYEQSLKDLNVTRMQETSLKSINENEEEYYKILNTETKEEDMIKFVEQQMNRIVNKY